MEYYGKCETCGSKLKIGGDDKEGTHYYMPVDTEQLIVKLERVMDCRNPVIAKVQVQKIIDELKEN